MPTPLSTAGAASGSDAWHELEIVLSDLGQLARSPLAAEAFYERLLAECVRALSANGGAAWLRAANGPFRPVAQFQWPGATLADDPDARRAHEALLSTAAAQGKLLTSDSGTLIAPIHPLALDGATSVPPTVAILEIAPRPGASPAAHRGYEQFLTAVTDIAAEYHTLRELARLRSEESYRDELVQLSSQIHHSVDLRPTAYAIANECRRVIGCDRLSVLMRAGGGSRLLATSGTSHVERRSSAAHQLEQLAELVRPTGELAWYADGQSDALPPIADALEAHAEQSHARHIAVAPVLPSTPRAAFGDEALTAARPTFTLVAEQFDDRTGRLEPARLLEVAELSATALHNSLAVEELPLRWLLRPIAQLKRAIAEHTTRAALIAAATLAAVAALVLIPARFTIEAPGTLEPVVRRAVYAPRGGIVDEVLVAPGAAVTAGAPLVQLRDPALDLELKRVRGERETVRRQLEAARATKSSRELRDESPVELYRLSASERELEQQLANLDSELTLLNDEQANLVVRSPIAGRVLTWDLANRLTARPVERGETLLTVADTNAAWQLELDVADDRIGHILAAQAQQSDRALPVRFRLHSADVPYIGEIDAVALTAAVDDTRDATAARPTVAVVVAFDKAALSDAAQRDLRPGMSARAEVDCGRRALGYVWLHDLWDTALTWLRF